MADEHSNETGGYQQVLIQLGKMEERLEQDRKAIWGNGKPGLLDKMSDINQNMAQLGMQMKNQNEKIDQLIKRIDEHKEMQSAIMSRVDRLEDDVALLKAKGGWWKELLAMGLSLVALGASACGMIFR